MLWALTLAGCFSQPFSGYYSLTWEDAWIGDCGVFQDDVPVPEDGDVELEFDGNDFTWRESGATLSCTFTDPDFACDPYEEFEDYSSQGVDALLGLSFMYDGEFDSNTTLDGTASMAINCGGSDCPALASGAEISDFPCLMSVDFEGEF